MSESTPVPANRRFRQAIRLICTARQARLHAEQHGPRVCVTLEQLADEHSRTAMVLVTTA